MTAGTDTAVPRADVKVRVPVWLVRREGLASGVLVGEVLRVTARGVQLRATVSVEPSDHCHRCGRHINHPVSLLVGYGPDCSAELGIPRADLEQDKLDEIRARMSTQHVRTLWLPRSKVEVLDGALEVPAMRCSMCGHKHEPKDGERFGTLDSGEPEWLCIWCQTDRYSEDPLADEDPAMSDDVYDGVPPPEFTGDPHDDEDYAHGGYDRADVAAEEAAERREAPPREAAPVQPAPPTGEIVTVRLGRTGGEPRLLVFSPFRLKDAIKALPGRRWDKAQKCWHVPASPASARDVVAMVERERCQLKLEDGADALIEQARRETAAASHKTSDDSAVPELLVRDTDAPHWLHQRRAYHYVQDLEAAGLFMEMSTGKSRVAVDLVCRADELRRVLIIGPNKAVGVWPREFRRHGVREVKVVAPRKGTIAKRAGEIDAALEHLRQREEEAPVGHTSPATVVAVINYEAAWREPMAEMLLRTEWDLVVLDESHRIKAPGGKASLFCAQLRKHARRRLALTGTPEPHSPLDVYAQYRFLDPGIFGTSFNAFRARYAVMGGFQDKQVVAFRVAPTLPSGGSNPYYDERLAREFAERMFSIAYRVEVDDVFDREPPLHVPMTFTLSPKAQRVYDDLERDLYAEVDTGTVTAANGLVRLLRLAQVTSGLLPVDDVEKLEEIDVGRRELLADVIEDLPTTEPVVVFCRFTHDLDNVQLVAERQGRRYMELSGRRSDGLTEEATMAEGCDVLGVQIQAGGVGIDLQRSHFGVFYNVNWSLGDYDQALKRQDRPGQTHRVRFFHLLAEGTVDERVYAALDARRQIVDYVLDLGRK